MLFCEMRWLKTGLMIVYLLSSWPVLASYHYCLGRVKQISFYEASAFSCGCPDPDEFRDCCDDRQEELDFQDDHQTTTQQQANHFWVFWLMPQVASGVRASALMQPQLLPPVHGPPRLGHNAPLFLLFDTWLI
jgi:hypothetical protein